MRRTRPDTIAMALGALSGALLLGALGFQYIGRLPPCEMCMWQRWPHLTAVILGLLGGWGLSRTVGRSSLAVPLAILTALAVGLSGAIGAYHAGVEWHWWPGPSQCTGAAFKLSGTLDLNAPVVMCDRAAWRLFGISMAGYNAIISLGAAILAFVLLSRRRGR